MRDLKALPLLYVEWVDSCSFNRWRGLDEYDTAVGEVQTVGWQIRRDKKAITLISSKTRSSGSGDITIPLVCIKRIVVLAGPRKRKA